MEHDMNKFFKNVALPLVLAASASAPQAFAQTVPSSEDIFNALANSAIPQITIPALVASGADPDTVASIASALGIPAKTISEVLPAVDAALGEAIDGVNEALGTIGAPVSIS
jgi:cytochrome P450